MLRAGECDPPNTSTLARIDDLLTSARTQRAEREDFVERGGGQCFGTTNRISCHPDH